MTKIASDTVNLTQKDICDTNIVEGEIGSIDLKNYRPFRGDNFFVVRFVSCFGLDFCAVCGFYVRFIYLTDRPLLGK